MERPCEHPHTDVAFVLLFAGLVGLVSAVTTLFYLYVQGVGGNRPPPKQD